MNLSRFLMNGVSRPSVSRSSVTSLREKASARRLGGVIVRTAIFTITVAFGSNRVPGTLPVTVYEPGARTWLLSVGDGQITRTSAPFALSRYVAGIVYGRCGSVPTVVSTLMSGTFASRDASGDSSGTPAVEIAGRSRCGACNG